MTGEQIWDSLVTLSVLIQTLGFNPNSEDGYDRFDQFSQMSAEDIFEEVMERYNSRKAQRNMNMEMDMDAKPMAATNQKCPIKPTRDVNPSITAKE